MKYVAEVHTDIFGILELVVCVRFDDEYVPILTLDDPILSSHRNFCFISKNSNRPIRIVEFGTYLAGPLTSLHLQNLLNAQITCVTRPVGSRGCREELHRMGESINHLRRNKNIVEVDLPTELQKVHDIILHSDVLIENFATGVSERLGIDYDACKRINPKIVYVSMPGFAPYDSEFRDIKAYEGIIMASAGVFCDMGLNRTLLGVESSYSPLPLSSVYASAYATYAVVCALRRRTEAQRIVVPLSSALCETMIHNSITFAKDKSYMNMRARRISEQKYPVTRDELRNLFDPFFCTYECKDGRHFYLVCPAHSGHQRNALRVLGILNEVLKFVPYAKEYSESPVSGIGSGHLTEEQASTVRPFIESAFLNKPAYEWEVLMGNSQVPGSAVRTTQEWRSSTCQRIWTSG